jgi:hypothetical protein
MMFRKKRFLLLSSFSLLALVSSFLLLSSGEEEQGESTFSAKKNTYPVGVIDTFVVDSTRNRTIPFAIVFPKGKPSKEIRLAIFSHGYGKNYLKNYLGYTYITHGLAKKGYWVLSIQHEQDGDPPLPMKGEMKEVRMLVWKKGEANILTVLHQFQKQNTAKKILSIDLIGHSNGGDMSLITASEFPKQFRYIITLDHLRFPIPLLKQPHFATLRSTDKTADDAVLPDHGICDSLGIKVIQLRKITHNEMNDYASYKQKKQIMTIIRRLLGKAN